MEFKGTKGNWYHELGTVSIWHPTKIGERIALVDFGFKVTEEDEANALLISKAPEMLEMLNKCLVITKALNCHIVSSEIEELIKSATEI